MNEETLMGRGASRGVQGMESPMETARAWLHSKRDLRVQFGENAYKSYIEPLDFAVETDAERIFLALNGGTQASWLRDKAIGQMSRRLDALTQRPKAVTIKVERELDPALVAAVKARASTLTLVDAGPAPVAVDPARPQWRGSFDWLCEGAANNKAVMLGRLIASRSAGLRMVMFRGEPGVGKTLLVESIANEALAQKPDLRVRLINGQRFTEDFVDALNRKRDTSAFKAYVREADLLIIDDVPRIAGRKHTEEELIDAILSVWDRGGFVVLTAVAGQSGVAAFGDRLSHHLKCATECEIALPDADLRRRILDMRVRHYASVQPGFSVAPEALDLIAARMAVSGRELDGAISQLVVEWHSNKAPVSVEVAMQALRTRIAEGDRKVTVDTIKSAVAKYFRMSVPELMRKTREKAVSHPRQIAMYLSCKLTTHSLPNVARMFGGYDHTTVLYSKRKVAKLEEECAETRRAIEEIIRSVRSWPAEGAQ